MTDDLSPENRASVEHDGIMQALRRIAATHQCAYGYEIGAETAYSIIQELKAVRSEALTDTKDEGGDWVLVPREPTEAMLEAFLHTETPTGPDRIVSWSVATSMARGNVFRHLDETVAGAYHAMLAAAPSKPITKELTHDRHLKN